MSRWTNWAVPLAITIVALTALAAFGPDARSVAAADRPGPLKAQVIPPQHPPTHTQPFIDGAVNPGAIPDAVAYRLFLRMLMTPGAGASADKMHRAYIKHILRTGAVLNDTSHTDHTNEQCDVHKAAQPTTDEVEDVLRFVRSYEPQLREIDRTSQALAQSGNRVAAQAMSPDRDALVQRALESLPSLVRDDTASKIHAYVRLAFKKKTKIFLRNEKQGVANREKSHEHITAFQRTTSH